MIAAPNAVPMSSAEGAAHPRAWNEALPLPVALEPDAAELEPEPVEDWLAPVLVVVLELLEPPPPHAASIITIRPPTASPTDLVRMGGQVTPFGHFAQRT